MASVFAAIIAWVTPERLRGGPAGGGPALGGGGVDLLGRFNDAADQNDEDADQQQQGTASDDQMAAANARIHAAQDLEANANARIQAAQARENQAANRIQAAQDLEANVNTRVTAVAARETNVAARETNVDARVTAVAAREAAATTQEANTNAALAAANAAQIANAAVNLHPQAPSGPVPYPRSAGGMVVINGIEVPNSYAPTYGVAIGDDLLREARELFGKMVVDGQRQLVAKRSEPTFNEATASNVVARDYVKGREAFRADPRRPLHYVVIVTYYGCDFAKIVIGRRHNPAKPEPFYAWNNIAFREKNKAQMFAAAFAEFKYLGFSNHHSTNFAMNLLKEYLANKKGVTRAAIRH